MRGELAVAAGARRSSEPEAVATEARISRCMTKPPK
jgi:hypothetical protein